MNRNDLYRSFNEVDEEALLRSELPCSVHRTRPRIRLIAASLALILCIWGAASLLSADDPNSKSATGFVMAAYAVDGNLTELGLNSTCLNSYFNSGSSDTRACFPDVDFPLFELIVKPADRDLYWDTDITISYNGVICDSLVDDHIFVSYLIPLNAHSAAYQYCITGWFEEETDMTITITDRERGGEMIDEFTVHVCYDADAQAYQLTVTDVQTNSSLR